MNFIAVVVVLLASVTQAVFLPREESPPYSSIDSPIPGEFIVVLTSPSERALYESSVSLLYSSIFTIGKTFQAYLYKNVNESTLIALRKNPSVAYVESNGRLYAMDIQKSPPSWGLKRVSKRFLPFEDQYEYPSSSGKDSRVYIVDTGIYLEHQDFGGRAKFGVTINTDGGDADCNGHGTHVSGTVGGTSYGLAKLATLVHVKVLGCGGSGAFSEVIGGIDWAVKDNAAQGGGKTGVINLSLGGSASQSVNDAVDAAFAGGILSCIAAGNDNFADACTKSPASASRAFTVAAADINDKPASFTNLGKCVNLWAPGVNINSAWIGSPDATRSLSGTSMAAPHVAGVAALILAESEPLTPGEVAELITKITTPDQIDYDVSVVTGSFANGSVIRSKNHNSFRACQSDADCARSTPQCCLSSGECIRRSNTCCGTVSGGCSLTSTCCSDAKVPYCARLLETCCGEGPACKSGTSCCEKYEGTCCPAGFICNPDNTCYNPFFDVTPNLNLFNRVDTL